MRFLLAVTLGYRNLESYGCIQIIVLIVTQCLNEAKLFSLFNVVQILCIRLGNSGRKPCVVFVVLIVLIVKPCQNRATRFDLTNAMQILNIPIKNNPAVVSIVLIVLIVT